MSPHLNLKLKRNHFIYVNVRVYLLGRLKAAMFSSLDQDKDSLTDHKTSDPRHRLIDFLSVESFDLLAHSNSLQEKVADDALDEGEDFSFDFFCSFWRGKHVKFDVIPMF